MCEHIELERLKDIKYFNCVYCQKFFISMEDNDWKKEKYNLFYVAWCIEKLNKDIEENIKIINEYVKELV